jgi:putative transcriptional regulator
MGIAHSLAPTLLIAMPQMIDPNFARAVVLLCRHETEGAMGLVVNRPSDTLVSQLLDVDPPLKGDSGLEAWDGGPVDGQRGWLLLGHDPGDGDAVAIAPGLFISPSLATLRAAIERQPVELGDVRFFLGYAGWGGQQLEMELAQSAWLTADVSRELLFATPVEEMWEAAIRSLGIDPFALQMGGGVH